MAEITPRYRCRACNAVFLGKPAIVSDPRSEIRAMVNGNNRRGLDRVVVHECTPRAEGVADFAGVQYEPEPESPGPPK